MDRDVTFTGTQEVQVTFDLEEISNILNLDIKYLQELSDEDFDSLIDSIPGGIIEDILLEQGQVSEFADIEYTGWDIG